MKQIVIFRRTEIVEVEVEVPQPLARATLAALANREIAGLGSPAFGRMLAHRQSGWETAKAEPGCECGPGGQGQGKTKKRRG